MAIESRFRTFLVFVLVEEKFFTSIHLKKSPNSAVAEKFIILGLLLEKISSSEYSSSSISAPGDPSSLIHCTDSHQWVVSIGWMHTAGISAAWNSQWTKRVAAYFHGAWFQSVSISHIVIHTNRVRLRPKGSISALRFD